MNNGLTSKEIMCFRNSVFIKANDEQLNAIYKLIIAERNRRKQREYL